MILAITIFVAIYSFLNIFLWLGWEKNQKFEIPKDFKFDSKDTQTLVSVLIPVRNEGKNILALLEDLANQKMPFSLFEVIIINDCSEDDTVAQVEFYQKISPYPLHLLHLPSKETFTAPKKEALKRGVTQAKGELILSTDGDCRVNADWIKIFWSFYQIHSPKLISAGVTFHIESSLFARLQVIEFASLVGSGASSLAWGIPTMANGANIAYPKAVFEEVNGFEGYTDIASGDDEFLMKKIADKYPHSIYFLKNKEAVVHTKAQESLKSFYAQRKRWGSKWKYYRDWRPKVLAFFIFVLHLGLLMAGGLSIFGKYPLKIFLFQLGAKFLVEFGYLCRLLIFFKKNKLIWLIIPLQWIYPFYVVVLGLAAQTKTYQWKGRKLK
jgi:cellulose synthase/poly-beta-1,6-N-acetylglucosamine synthase-like glycosyltransferase